MSVSFEPNVGQADARTEFVGRGVGTTALLTRAGIEFAGPRRGQGTEKSRNIAVRFFSARRGRAASPPLAWRGVARLAGETNYFLGNDPARWRTHVPHFGEAEARNVIDGVDAVAYGRGKELEYDLRVAPGTNPADLRLEIRGAEKMRVDARGDLVMVAGARELRMRKPVIYEEIAERPTPSLADNIAGREMSEAKRRPANELIPSARGEGARKIVEGEYAIHADGTVGFRVGRYDAKNVLVIDPSLSVGYATFLGGAGDDRAASVAIDSAGKIYIGGTTTSASTFMETSGTRLGSTGGNSDYFVAKIDPTKTGPGALVYLTFIGGSGTEAGGEIAVDANGNVALAGTTTSADYPVTDSSTLTMGVGGIVVNDAAITEIGPTGATLGYSTLFGGNGNEGTLSQGGIAFDSSGNIFVGMDTQSTNLTVAPVAAPGPFSAQRDGYVAGSCGRSGSAVRGRRRASVCGSGARGAAGSSFRAETPNRARHTVPRRLCGARCFIFRAGGVFWWWSGKRGGSGNAVGNLRADDYRHDNDGSNADDWIDADGGVTRVAASWGHWRK
jgi:hypothetical protein